MQRFARWHIWLGWLVGVPILMWMVTGLVMAARPSEEVRGQHLRAEQFEETLPRGVAFATPFLAPGEPAVESYVTAMRSNTPVTTVTFVDGTRGTYNATTGQRLDPFDETFARQIVREQIVGPTETNTTRPGPQIQSVSYFPADKPPFDFRRPLPVWQIVLEDGAHIYVGADSGQIEAVRTRWWRIFDFMWGLHIMDLSEREDTSHPILILFAALGVIGSLLGCVLMFRRRRARVRA